MKKKMHRINKKLLLRSLLFAAVGALGGFAYYYYIGCYSGTCPISSNPYISTSYGMMAGLLLSWDSGKKEKKN
jgi:hypothetical protein